MESVDHPPHYNFGKFEVLLEAIDRLVVPTMAAQNDVGGRSMSEWVLCPRCQERVLAKNALFHHCAATEAVDHPQHYNFGKFEVIDVIEDWGLGFHEANALKYIARAKHKGHELEDLKKARWYLDRKIQKLEKVES